MQQRPVVAAVVALILGAVVAAPLLYRGPSYIDISGHVYDGTGGVVGAVVSNDWDATTSTTDTQGEFRMRVRRVAADEWIKLSARSGEAATCHRQVGPLKSRTVDMVHMVLDRPC